MTSQSSLNSHRDLQILSEADAVGNFVQVISIVSSALFDQSASLERRTRCMFRLRSAVINGIAEPVSVGPYATFVTAESTEHPGTPERVLAAKAAHTQGRPAADKTL